MRHVGLEPIVFEAHLADGITSLTIKRARLSRALEDEAILVNLVFSALGGA